MRTRRAAMVVCAAVALAGCSSSSSGRTSTAPAASPAPTSGGGSAETATTAPSTGGSLPSVSGATDLTREPKIGPGAGTPPTSLATKDLVVGTGAAAGPNATVKVQYVGALYGTGKVFDASWTDNGPATFPLSEVVPGFKDAIVGMRIGGRREVVIPPALGYGAAGSPPVIPPNATLVFVIDLLGIS